MTKKTLLIGSVFVFTSAMAFADPGAPSAYPSAGAYPVASASASTSGHVPAKPAGPHFSDDLPPPDPSPVPAAGDWATATTFVLDHDGGLDNCTARRIREWVRVECKGLGASAGLVAGPAEGYSGFVGVPAPKQPDDSASYYVQFPVRRGERRLMELRHAGRGNWDDTIWATVGTDVSTQWLDGEMPLILAQNNNL